ncbi:sialidase family protein [Flavilitoribacter nigricans]|uniref:exo-alpha-sialidase n=1 Tax=Flavilitoribacter nigricans (strain ATCC 23147 / DSM 23189 / NBRC 102662 / NCIMB 1420 / SS-2) TaxID=1122177 RepID=A0A2D0NC11_FLAN2|nr:sialidase family protein [Flavilitoribacter nigricans]PHN05926.1 hypothetical protein CRP01_13180 [Flavilitoribacter nigricans DSM 23189 = NBRC 102662]
MKAFTPPNRTYYQLICLALFLSGLSGFSGCKTAGISDPSVHWFIRDGQAVDIVDETGDWAANADGLTATGDLSRLHAGKCVGSGDFELFARLRIEDLSQDNASLMLDAAGPVETGELIFSRNGNITVRGFFFGDRTQRVRPVAELIRPGAWFDLNVRRRGDTVEFRIADSLVWSMQYANERPFGKLTLKPGRAQLSVRKFGLWGKFTPLSEWIPRLERHYPVAGDQQVDVFTRGQAGYHTFRIPTLVRSKAGTLLAFAEGRKDNAADHGNVDLVLRRSTDGGQSWQKLQLVYEEGGTAKVTIGNPVPVVDRETGNIWLFFCRDNKNVLVTKSTDDGMHWTTPTDLTDSLKEPDWGSWYATGPCHGIQLTNGRLVVPANHGRPSGSGTQPHMIISDDHGKNWRIGGLPETNANENTVAEIETNQLYVNMRSSNHNNRKPYCREVAWSPDGGDNFGPTAYDCKLPDSICQGSLLRFNREDGLHMLVFSNPASQRRERLTVRTSADGGRNWSAGTLIYGGSAAYSDLVQIDGKTLGILFERDLYQTITFVRSRLSTLSEDETK